ncbi:hypothetical protein CQA57_05710 [Helicobacter anseris]|uniref:Lipoprotein n=1 Tax=Helicobacter anseris TaxID=375926 RepID=A0A3D8J831_9HELI|nr:hypothetical protein [Helicobacter anseris]RDU73021.1 hypothetical protein CQA57_05710 [Helicobacter anseris]
MKKLTFLFLSLLFALFFNACSIGDMATDCDSNGCNYRRAGLCTDAFSLLNEDPDEIEKRAYKGVKCKDR